MRTNRMNRACLAAALVGLFAAPMAEAATRARPPVAELSADLNGDGVPDRVVMSGEDDEVDVTVYLSEGGRLPDKPTLHKQAVGWKGAMAGTEPSMSATPRGSLILVFQNDSVGRDRWRQQLTIAVRNGALVVAGYTYTARDTLDPKNGFTCDVNLLSGKGQRNGKPFTVPTTPLPLADWNDTTIPPECAF